MTRGPETNPPDPMPRPDFLRRHHAAKSRQGTGRAQPARRMKTKQFLQGKLTYLGILLTALGALGNLFGFTVPTDEVKGIVSWLQANWDQIMELVGLVVAAYGRLRINWRKETA